MQLTTRNINPEKGIPGKSWNPANYASPPENSPGGLVSASLYEKAVEGEEAFAGQAFNLVDNFERPKTPFCLIPRFLD